MRYVGRSSGNLVIPGGYLCNLEFQGVNEKYISLIGEGRNDKKWNSPLSRIKLTKALEHSSTLLEWFHLIHEIVANYTLTSHERLNDLVSFCFALCIKYYSTLTTCIG